MGVYARPSNNNGFLPTTKQKGMRMVGQWGKRVSAALVALALVHAGATWWVGKKIEAYYHGAQHWQLPANAQAALAEKGLVITLQPQAFKRGWFASTAEFAVRAESSGTALPDVLWQQKIFHGPLPWQRLLRLQWRPVLATGAVRLNTQAMQATLAEYLPEGWLRELSQALSLTYKLGFNGAATSEFRAQALALTQGGSRWQSEPMHVQATVDSEGRLQAFDAQVQQLLFVAEQWLEQFSFQLDVDGLQVAAKQKALSGERWQYTSHSKAKAINVHLHDEQANHTLEVQLQGIAAQQRSNLGTSAHGDIVHASHNEGSIADVALNGRSLGSLQLAWLLENLAIGALANLADLGAEDMATLDELLAVMLALKPTFALQQLTWQNQGGEATLHAKASAGPNELLAPELGVVPKARAQVGLLFDGPMLQQLAKDVDAITTQYRNTSDERNALVESLAMYDVWLGELVAFNMLQQEDERYRLDVELELEQGLRLFLNGYDVSESELAAAWFMLMLLFSGTAP